MLPDSELTGRNSDVQILRAVAILYVLVHHARFHIFANLSPFWEQFYRFFFGTTGVDLFFVISGFVIIRSLMGSLAVETRHDAIKFFWIKRIYRILPAAWLWLAIIILLTLFVNKSGAFGSFRAAFEGSVAAILNVANIRLADCFGRYECGTTDVYWSLSLEEQFYILLPLLVVLSRRFLPVVLIIFVLSQILIPVLTLPSTYRATGLALGVLLGWYSHTKEYRIFFISPLEKVKARLFFALLCFCLAVTLHPGLNIVSERLGYQLVAIVSAFMVYMASMNCIGFFGDGRLKQLMCWIGDRSFSLYLSHVPAFALSKEIVYYLPAQALDGLNMNMILASLSVFIMFTSADICFRYVEQPFQRKARERIRKGKASTAIEPVEPADSVNLPV